VEGLSEVLATADELYGLLPEAFVAARDERVRSLRAAGSRARAVAVKDLRRPSVAGWLVNALVRHRRDEVERLLTLGQSLREAQAGLDADQLRELGRQRQAVLSAITREAKALARELGRPVTDQVASEVEETLRAALADPAAASAVRSGRLTAALSYAGFGETDVADVVALRTARSSPEPPDAMQAPGAVQPGALPPGPDSARQAALREAMLAVRATEEAARHAQGAALVAEQHRDGVQRRARTARERLDLAHAQVADLESRLSSARAAASTAAAAWAPVHAEADAASARAEAARGVAERARAMLESARAHLADVERDVT
jgi:hypothetical protein